MGDHPAVSGLSSTEQDALEAAARDLLYNCPEQLKTLSPPGICKVSRLSPGVMGSALQMQPGSVCSSSDLPSSLFTNSCMDSAATGHSR